MKTAQHCICILTLLLFTGLFYAVMSTPAFETTKSDSRDNPNINDIFPGDNYKEIMCVIHC
jgi:hypothetical protein